MCLHILKLILALFGNMNFEKILEWHSELDKDDDVGDNQSVDFSSFHKLLYSDPFVAPTWAVPPLVALAAV